MRKIYTLFFLCLLACASFAAAAINIDPIGKKDVNLGDKVLSSFNLSSDRELEALFRLSLKCDSFDLDYYTIPISLKEGINKSIIAAPITANSQMIGTCNIRATLQSTDKSYSEESQTGEFQITSRIDLKAGLAGGTNYYPGDKVSIEGEITQSFNPSKTIVIQLETQTISFNTKSANFNQTLELSKSIKSGQHTIIITANDSFGNSGYTETDIQVAQVPTTILIDPEKERANPGEEIRIYSVILDQANDTMPGKISLKITSQEKKEIFTKEIESKENLKFKIDSYLSPGVYTIRGTAAGLKTDKKLVVNAVTESTISFDEKRIVTIKNTGNVAFDKIVDLKLTASDGTEISVNKKASLKPGEELKVDLFHELPAGNYKLTFTSGDQLKEYSNIATKDERNIGKKTADTLTGATGLVFGTPAHKGILYQKPFLSVFIVLGIVTLIVLVYQGERKRRADVVNRKENSEAADRKMKELLDDEKPLKTDDDKIREQNQKFVDNMLKEKEFK